MLKDEKTREKVELAMDNICKIMPKSVEVSLKFENCKSSQEVLYSSKFLLETIRLLVLKNSVCFLCQGTQDWKYLGA